MAAKHKGRGQAANEGEAAAAAQAPPAQGSRTWALYALLISLAAVFAIYTPALNGPFLFDDEYLFFRDLAAVDRIFQSLTPFGRPLMNLTFWVNAKLFGDNPWTYHAGNVLFHWANAILVYLVLARLLGMNNVAQPRRRWLALAGAALFLVHPALTESVAYVSARSESLSLLFFLGAYLLFLRHREGGIGWAPAFGVIVLFGAAFLSKEHTAVLPALLVWTDLWFSNGRPVATLRANWRLYVPLTVMAAAGLSIVWRVLSSADTAGFAMKDLPWYAYFFTQWRALWIYLRLFVAPAPLNADYVFVISRTPLDHGAILGLAGLLALLGVSFFYRKRFPLAFFGLIVFFLLMAPTSSIVPIKDPVAERRLYLPVIGLLLAACDLLSSWKASRNTVMGAVGAVLVLFAGLTFERAQVWADPVHLWQDTAAKNPTNFRAHFQLAMAHYNTGACQESLPHFEKASQLKANDYSLLLDWGLAYDCLNQFDEALAKFRQAATIEKTGHVHALIGMVLAKQQKPGAALEALNEAMRLDPNYDNTYVYRGHVFRMMNDPQQAAAAYRQALALKPDNEAAQTGLAAVESTQGTKP